MACHKLTRKKEREGEVIFINGRSWMEGWHSYEEFPRFHPSSATVRVYFLLKLVGGEEKEKSLLCFFFGFEWDMGQFLMG